MSIPCIRQTAMAQHAAASPSVPVSVPAVAAGVARVTAPVSAGTPAPRAAGGAAVCGSAFMVASVVSPGVLWFAKWRPGACGQAGRVVAKHPG